MGLPENGVEIPLIWTKQWYHTWIILCLLLHQSGDLSSQELLSLLTRQRPSGHSTWLVFFTASPRMWIFHCEMRFQTAHPSPKSLIYTPLLTRKSPNCRWTSSSSSRTDSRSRWSQWVFIPLSIISYHLGEFFTIFPSYPRFSQVLTTAQVRFSTLRRHLVDTSSRGARAGGGGAKPRPMACGNAFRDGRGTQKIDGNGKSWDSIRLFNEIYCTSSMI